MKPKRNIGGRRRPIHKSVIPFLGKCTKYLSNYCIHLKYTWNTSGPYIVTYLAYRFTLPSFIGQLQFYSDVVMQPLLKPKNIYIVSSKIGNFRTELASSYFTNSSIPSLVWVRGRYRYLFFYFAFTMKELLFC